MFLWTSDTAIDGENPVDLDEVDLILIDPLPSYVWYQDMVDFADGISDRAAGRSLSRSLNGRGAFRRFRNELYERHPELVSVWQSLREARARGRAVGWLVEQGLLEEEAARRFTNNHPGPPCRDHLSAVCPAPTRLLGGQRHCAAQPLTCLISRSMTKAGVAHNRCESDRRGVGLGCGTTRVHRHSHCLTRHPDRA